MPFIEATAPTVIDEGLCRSCIQLLQPKELATGVESESYRHQAAHKQATLPFGEAECLMFSFKNILKIDNLQGFDKLVKLYLDNNVIVTIEKLDHLVNLEWLDLSFNNIEKISGLDKLAKLENLSLFNNRISSLDGLEAVSGSLQVLSIGSNLITDLDETKKLRKFDKLHAVTFAGNEIAVKQPHEYRAFVLAHLRHLRFLDYRLVDEAEVAQAEADGGLQEKLQEIRVHEQKEEEAREQQRKAAARSALLRDAHMEALDSFWLRMEQATAEFTGKTSMVEQLVELQTRQRAKFEGRLEEFVQGTLTAVSAKAAEVREYAEAAEAMKADNNAEALAHIAKYNAELKKAKKLFAASAGRDTAAADQERLDALAALKEANEQLYDQLMEIELVQVDQFVAALDAFETNYAAMHAASMEAISSTFLSLRDLQTAWVAEAHEIATLRHETFVEENEADKEELADELKAVLNDKEGMLASIESAREARISFLDATEDALAKAETAAYRKVLNDLRDAEHRRNRGRINEISHLVRSTNQEAIDKLDSSMDE